MSKRCSNGYQKKTNLFIITGENPEINIKHREKEKDYRIFLKIKYNFKKFSKMEKLVKITIAFALKIICKIIVLIIKFS